MEFEDGMRIRNQFDSNSLPTKVCPEIFNPRKMDSNIFEANFGYFRLSIARDDENNIYRIAFYSKDKTLVISQRDN